MKTSRALPGSHSLFDKTESAVPAPMQVAIVYTHIPHYREAVFRRLISDGRTRYTIYTSRGTLDSTIKSYDGAGIDDRSRLVKFGPFVWQTNLWDLVFNKEPEVVIFLGNPYILSTWIYAFLARMVSRKVVLFWTHGWTRGDTGPKPHSLELQRVVAMLDIPTARSLPQAPLQKVEIPRRTRNF